MRIAFVCYWNKLARDGVAYKVEGQVARWRAEGHDVEVFCVTRSERAEECVAIAEKLGHGFPGPHRHGGARRMRLRAAEGGNS